MNYMGKSKKKNIRYLFLLIASIILSTGFSTPPYANASNAVTANTTNAYLSMKVLDTATLTLSGITSGITWKSSNKKILSVTANGTITAKKKGTTTVIATYNGRMYKWTIIIKNSLASACKSGDISDLSKTDKQIVNKVYTIISETITSTMSDYSKVKTIHDYIVLNCMYDIREVQSIPNTSYHPAGCLLYKTCVCQGYAETFQLFMNALGIKNKQIRGYATNENGQTQSHAWNSIKLGKKWYHIDLTWDDPTPDTKNYVRYNYFLRNDTFFLQDHIWNQEDYPACSGTAYTMKPYKDLLVSNESEAEASFLSQQKKGTLYYTFVYKTGTEINFSFLYNYTTHVKYFSPVNRESYSIYVVFFQ
ncbi:MAG: transglutaminase domain-containing protein [Velocimicrobium sp.]